MRARTVRSPGRVPEATSPDVLQEPAPTTSFFVSVATRTQKLRPVDDPTRSAGAPPTRWIKYCVMNVTLAACLLHACPSGGPGMRRPFLDTAERSRDQQPPAACGASTTTSAPGRS